MTSRVLLGSVIACCAGALSIALGAPRTVGALVTAAIVLATLLGGRAASSRTAQPWHPVQVVTKAALLAVAVTAGAALVAYSLNQPSDVDPPRANSSDMGYPNVSAPGATLTQLPFTSPEAPPSTVEEQLSEDEPTPEEPTPSDEPTRKPAKPAPTPSPDPTPEPTPTPTPTPSPSPSPSPSPTKPGLCDGLLGVLCP